MNDKDQIKELSAFLFLKTPVPTEEMCDKTAEALHNAGWRKQSKGEWKKKGNEKTCSRCKFIYYSNNDEWTYCPNCGARMKGE